MFSALVARTSSAGAGFGWPTQCAVCRRWGRAALCGDCRARHATPVPRCLTCAVTVPVGVAQCGECLRRPPLPACTIAAVDYAYPWSGWVAGLKFHGATGLAPTMSALMAERIHAAQRDAMRPLVLPVPLGRTRLAERGMNQSWELARRVARRLRLEAAPALLQRVVETPHLADLPRAARARAIRGAFRAAPAASTRLRGRHVALVDDVLTTGATATEAALALQEAGAVAVDLWVFARTPAPGSA